MDMSCEGDVRVVPCVAGLKKGALETIIFREIYIYIQYTGDYSRV